MPELQPFGAESHRISKHPPLGLETWPIRRALTIGIVALALATGIAIASLQSPPTLETLILISLYSVLFATGLLILHRIEDGIWTSYAHMIALVTLLTIDLSTALFVIIGGALLATFWQWRPARFLRLQPLPLELALSLSLARVAITGSAVLVAAFVSQMLMPKTGEALLVRFVTALAITLIAAFIAAAAADSIVRRRLNDLPARLRWLILVGRIPLEVILFLVILIFGLLAPFLPLSLQMLCVVLLILQALRYKNVQRMQAELPQRVAQLSQINRSGEVLSSTLSLEALIEIICLEAKTLTGVHHAEVTLLDVEQGTFTVYSVKRGGGLQQREANTADTLSVDVIRRNTLIEPMRRITVGQNSDNDTTPDPVIGLPLIVGATAIGALVLYQEPPRLAPNPATRDVLQMFARQAGLALNNALLYRDSQELVSHLSLINASVQDTINHLDRVEGIGKATEAALTVGKASAVLLVLSSADTDRLEMVASAGLNDDESRLYREFFKSEALHLPSTSTTLHASTLVAEPTLSRIAALSGFLEMRMLPLASGRDLNGWLLLAYKTSQPLRQSEQELLHVLAQHIAASLDNAELFNALESYAFEMAQLAHLSRMTASNLELEHVAGSVGEILNQMLTVDRTTIALFESDDGPLGVAGTVHGLQSAPTGERDNRLADFPELADQLRQPNPEYRVYHADEPLSEALRQQLAANGESSLAAVPLVASERVVGAVLLGSIEKRTFSEREWQLAEMAANQIAAQIQNAQLYTVTHLALRQRLEELALIEDLAQQISSSLDFDQIVQHMLEAALASTQAHYAALMLVTEPDSPQMTIIEYTGGVFSRYTTSGNPQEGLIAQALQTGRTILTTDTHSSPYYVAPRTGIRYASSLAVPLVRESSVLGVLNVESEAAAAFTDAHVSFLNNLAGHAVISIGNAQMLEERQVQVKVLTNLQSLALRLSSTGDTPSTAQAILETTLALLKAHSAVIYRYDTSRGALVPLAWLAKSGPQSSHAATPGAGAHQAARTGERQTTRVAGAVDIRQTTVDIPLRIGERIRDVLSIHFEEHSLPTAPDFETLSLLTSQAAGHLENALLHEEISARNEQMTAILDSTRDGVILIDRQGMLVETNPAARRLLGDGLIDYLDDVLSSPIWLPTSADPTVVRLHPPDGDEAQLTRRQFERDNGPDGIVYIEEIGSPVLDEHGAAAGWLLVLRDISEERLLNDYRDEITSMVVHDLRGPLASIISGLYVAQDELAPVSDMAIAHMTVTMASESASNLMMLVESLLDVSKMEAREMVLRLDAVPVERLFERAATALTPAFQEAGVTLQRALQPGLPALYGDYDLLARVVINLVDNALRYSPSGGIVLVGAEAVDDGTAVRLRVADCGPGIPVDERERVFEKFKQVKGSSDRRGKRGTGLGLTFCRLAVEAHGGRIWIEEQGPLPGASFLVWLPVAGLTEGSSVG